MRCIYRLLRRYLKARRYLLKDGMPHWLRDLLGIVKYINVLGLIMPLAAITLASEHFFHRLPQYMSTKESWFGSPVKFFTRGVTLMATLSFFIGNTITRFVPEAERVED